MTIFHLIFMLQDGAKLYIPNKVMEDLSAIFGRRIMSDKGPKYGGKDWSPCSPDLSPLDFFFWSCMKVRFFIILIF